MKLTEIFYSIQGEGVKQGAPSLFIRLWGCNLTCGFDPKTKERIPGTWECDSTTSWLTNKKDAKDIEWKDMSNKINEVDIPWNAQVSNIDLIFTGGEPLMFIDQWAIHELGILNGLYGDIFFETNGTIDIKIFEEALMFVKFNCSPKLANSGMPLKKRYNPDVLYNIGCTDGSCFKFVVKQESDLEEINKIVDDCELPNEMIYLMPEGQTREEINKHLLVCEKLAKQMTWNISNRMQVQIHNKCMGV